MPFVTKPVIEPGSLSSTPQPTLHSSDAELVLRTPAFADAPAVHNAFQDPTLRHWHIRSMDSLEEARDWVAETHTGWREEKTAQWIVARAADDTPLGRMALRELNFLDGVAEVAYWVMPEARGASVAPRALDALTDWAFALGFHRLDLQHSTRNEPSCRVALKAGYELEGTRRSSALHTDGWHDMHVHMRLNS
ncbi:GNAT family N-acetyltransferase [Streptomyces sp. NPDC102360]|uniref:GNAT family N-acetyltransferase n=1 Tax=Streptomyces sp. NPDC102360 TaxID=3366160 RepID=UPI0038073E36